MKVNVIGAGLAGVEATYQLIKRGIEVRLFEMRPNKNTDAHHTADFAELVCSNSLRSNSLENAVGILKEEMRIFDSIIMKYADEFQVPAGSSLAVDRNLFSYNITKFVKEHPLVEVIYEEVTTIPSGPTIIATGPLTSGDFCETIKDFLGTEYLSFYDAAAPLVKKESLDLDKVYLKSRYDKGEAAYYNAAMNKEQYDLFYKELVNAEVVLLKDFEKNVFEGCMPIEVMAKRGYKTMLFGPLKPVGLERDSEDTPYAVVQLRQDDVIGELLNIVGFQTNLKFKEQKRVLSLIPGFEKIEIARYGVMHKNVFINSPMCLNKHYQSVKNNDLFFAGQITGVEGYVESAASGLLAGINMANYVMGKELLDLSSRTVIGSMVNYISDSKLKKFQPMNANFELLTRLEKHDKKLRKQLYCKRALEEINEIKRSID